MLLTGAQAAGKSTVGRALASRADRGVFLDGDTFWQAVVSGRIDMAGDPTPGALEQLHLRYRATAAAAQVYARAGFLTVIADNVYGDALFVVREALSPLELAAVALIPSPEMVAARERGRGSHERRVATPSTPRHPRSTGLRQRFQPISKTSTVGAWPQSRPAVTSAVRGAVQAVGLSQATSA